MATPDTTVGVESLESVRAGIKPSTPNIKTENCYFLHPAAVGKPASPENSLVDWRKELKRFEEFGLGLGVDATNPSPFANRKSFHVRQIDLDTIICMDEGGALHSIFQKLETTDENTIQLSASVTLPHTPIRIGTAVEYSRSTTRRGYTIGREVITRSVGFRMDRHRNEEAGLKNDHFEEWINEHLTIRPYAVRELIELIIRYGITHYVSKIQLGAALYCTMSEVYYSSFVKGKKGIGVDKIAELALSASKKQTNSTEVSETKRIGFMSDDCVVRRGTYDEAVVDVELESVANLIKGRSLKDALTKALRIYVATRGFSRIGYQPSRIFDCLVDFSDGDEIDGDAAHGYKHDESHKYAIFCNHGNDTLFLDINNESNNEVIARKLQEDPEENEINFFRLRCTETPGEFIILNYKDIAVDTKELQPNFKYDFWPTPTYLKVNTHLGYNSGPLRMEKSVDEYHCRLTLRPRLFHEHSHATMSDFTNGKDMFYICTSSRRGRTGYLYVKDRGEGADPRYVLACKPSIKRDDSDELMLFRLVRYENIFLTEKTYPKGTEKTYPKGTEKTYPKGTEKTYPKGTEKTYPKGTEKTYPKGTEKTYPKGTEKTYPKGTEKTYPKGTEKSEKRKFRRKVQVRAPLPI
eukprot:Em0002g1683a